MRHVYRIVITETSMHRIEEASTILGVSTATVHRLIEPVRVGAKVFFRGRDLLEYLDGKEIPIEIEAVPARPSVAERLAGAAGVVARA